MVWNFDLNFAVVVKVDYCQYSTSITTILIVKSSVQDDSDAFVKSHEPRIVA